MFYVVNIDVDCDCLFQTVLRWCQRRTHAPDLGYGTVKTTHSYACLSVYGKFAKL